MRNYQSQPVVAGAASGDDPLAYDGPFAIIRPMRTFVTQFWLAALLGGMAAVACADTVGTKLPLVTREALDAARSRWLSAAPESYEFTGRCGGWVVLGREAPWKIKVSNGRVTSAQGYDGYLDLREPPTMAAVFDEIVKRLDSPGFAAGKLALRVEFDATLGYPRDLYIEDLEASDSWARCTIRKVRIH